MKEKNLFKNNYVKWGLIFGAWAFIAIVFTIKHSISAASFGKEFSFINSIITQSVSCLGWVILTPLIIWTVERFLPEGKHSYRKLTLLILSGIGIVLLQTAYQAIVLPIFMPSYKFVGSTFWESYRDMFISNWLLSAALYIMTLGLILIATFYKKYQKRELLSTRLEANLSRTRLQLLKMQLHPHFLFNTHNAISELIHNDPNTAEKMLTTLSDLLRISLDKLEIEEVPLQQELEFVEKYIQIEQMRFQERLKFKMNIDPETLDAIVPNMVLQPLIENAVKHGITPLAQGGTIELSCYRKGNQLYLRVSDDGVGLPEKNGKFVVKGIGLSNTKARLLHLYKDEQSFEINPNNEKGFTVLLKIPFKKEEIEPQPQIELFNAKLIGNN
jgi:sensor histidine kinase YesM